MKNDNTEKRLKLISDTLESIINSQISDLELHKTIEKRLEKLETNMALVSQLTNIFTEINKAQTQLNTMFGDKILKIEKKLNKNDK